MYSDKVMLNMLEQMKGQMTRPFTTKALMYWNLGRITGYGYATFDSDTAIAVKNEANFLIGYWERHYREAA